MDNKQNKNTPQPPASSAPQTGQPQSTPTPPSNTPQPPTGTPPQIHPQPGNMQQPQVQNAGAPTPPMKVPQPPKANKKLLTMMAIAMVVLLGVVGGIFFFVLGRDSEEATVSSQDASAQAIQEKTLQEQVDEVQLDEVDTQIQDIEKELNNL